jgi:hypothetical protein
MGGNANGSMYKHTLSLIQDRPQGSLAIINAIRILSNTANRRIPRALSEEKSRLFRRVMIDIVRDCSPTPKANGKKKSKKQPEPMGGNANESMYKHTSFLIQDRPQGSLAIINAIRILNNTANRRIPRAPSKENSRLFCRVVILMATILMGHFAWTTGSGAFCDESHRPTHVTGRKEAVAN